jgi:P-type Ca2+ transporter type 2C
MFIFISELGSKDTPSQRDLTMTFTTFVFFDLFNALCCRHNHKPVFELSWNSNNAFLVAIGLSIVGQLFVVYFKPLQNVFRTASLSLSEMAYLVCLTSTICIVDTIRKKFFPDLFTEVYPGSKREVILDSGASKKSETADQNGSGAFIV